MTELLVTPKSLSHLETLIDIGADAFVIGEQKFGLRLPGEFNREDIKQAVNLAHEHDENICCCKWHFPQLSFKCIGRLY